MTPRLKQNINYGLWVMMCQGRLISCNKYTTVVGDVDSGGGYTSVGSREWRNSVLATPFCCEP